MWPGQSVLGAPGNVQNGQLCSCSCLQAGRGAKWHISTLTSQRTLCYYPAAPGASAASAQARPGGEHCDQSRISQSTEHQTRRFLAWRNRDTPLRVCVDHQALGLADGRGILAAARMQQCTWSAWGP